MKEHFSSRVTKLLVILALAIVASVMFVFVGCGEQHVHTWTQTNEQAATCTADGFIEYTCEECGDVRQEPVQATGHQWKDNGALQTHPATCTESGYYYKLCTVCNYEETSDRIPATGHTIDFKAATTKVTLPTCTTAGSITGTCADCGATVTYTSAQIAADKDADGLNITIANQPEDNVKVGTQETLYYPIVNGVKGDFLGVLGHEYANPGHQLHCVAIYTNRTLPGDAAFGTQETNYYWNYCERCDTAFEVEDHTVPAGYIPCENYINPNNNLEAEVPAGAYVPAGEEYANVGDPYAYQCSACKAYLDAVPHEYELKSLVSGEPGSTTNPPVWADAPEGATFSCEYYQVCKWCGDDRISAPHTPSMAEPTCTEGVMCTVCEKIIEPATGHTNTADGAFGPFEKDSDTEFAQTCVSAQGKYLHCVDCAAREAKGEEVEWVLGENYILQTTGTAAGHAYGASAQSFESGKVETDTTNKVAEKVYDTSTGAIGCARPYWFTDVCQNAGCTDETTGHVRVSVKPTTVYTKGNDGKGVAVTVGEKGLDTGNIYYLDAACTKQITSVAAFNAGFDNDGRPYTDEQGRYGYQQGGSHAWEFQTTANGTLIDYLNDKSLTEFVAPKCTTPGKALYYCADCGEYSWRSITMEEFYDDMHEATVNLKLPTSQQYDTYEVAIAKAANHDASMYDCNHHKCSVCDPNRNHGHQWSVAFVTKFDQAYTGDVKLPTINTAYGFNCYDETTDMNNFKSVISNLNANFTYKFYPTDSYSGTEFNMEALYNKMGNISGNDPGDTYSDNITLYVRVTPKAAPIVAADGFGTWNADESLNVDFAFNNNLIKYTTITKMEISVIDADNKVVASANASGSVLSKLLSENMKDWDANNDGKLDDATKLTVSVPGFATDSGATGAADGTWAFGGCTAVTGTNYTVTITITCGTTTFTYSA